MIILVILGIIEDFLLFLRILSHSDGRLHVVPGYLRFRFADCLKAASKYNIEGMLGPTFLPNGWINVGTVNNFYRSLDWCSSDHSVVNDADSICWSDEL